MKVINHLKDRSFIKEEHRKQVGENNKQNISPNWSPCASGRKGPVSLRDHRGVIMCARATERERESHRILDRGKDHIPWPATRASGLSTAKLQPQKTRGQHSQNSEGKRIPFQPRMPWLLPQFDYWPRQIFLDINHFLNISVFLFLYCLYQVMWSGKQTVLGGMYLIEKIRHNTVGRLRGGRSEESVSGSWEIQKCRNQREVCWSNSWELCPHCRRWLNLNVPWNFAGSISVHLDAVSLGLRALCGCGAILDEGQAISARNWLPQEQPSVPKGHQLPRCKWENLEIRST